MSGEPNQDFRSKANNLLDTFINASDVAARGYLEIHRKRYIETIKIIDDIFRSYLDTGTTRKLRILELGTSGFFPVIFNNLLDLDCVDITEYSNPVEFPIKYNNYSIGDYSVKTKAYQIDFGKSCFPCGDNYYDLVICLEVLEHIERDPILFMSEINRILVDDGLILISTPNICSINRLKQILTGWHPHFFCAFNRNLSNDRHHLEYSPPLIRQLIDASGFDEVYFSTFDAYADADPDIIKLLVERDFPTSLRGDTIISVSQKVSQVRVRFPDMLYA